MTPKISWRSVLILAALLAACDGDRAEDPYHTDKGEGSSVTIILQNGPV
ncbi:hypothetical protein [Paracoccus sp. IB05]|nr:hypothetical protein [Paracoccus sp. IB05]MBJ2151629.1 hypothetical protein [Paracoccus sp. IB05]